MQVLVFNAGSSSLKFGVFDLSRDDSRLIKGEFERFSPSGCLLHWRAGGEQGKDETRPMPCQTISQAIAMVPELLQQAGMTALQAVGHRVAHGGERFHQATVIDDDVLRYIEACTPLAPLHNPANLDAIELSRLQWPDIPQVAVFDTAFHHSIPAYATTYAVPEEWRKKGLRRYGFHGTSHRYVALRAADAMQSHLTDLRLISCHLGNGASLCAISHGLSVDTSMGMTPLEGLVMGSRSGDVDPGMFAFLQREMGLSAIEIEQALYQESGLKALTGTHDMRDIEQRAAEGDNNAQLAIQLYAYRVRKYIGAYAAAMGGVDALVFTGGIGEHSATMRRRICDQLGFMGMMVDEDANSRIALQGFECVPFHMPHSRVRLWVTQTNEQYMIARETCDALKQCAAVQATLASSSPEHGGCHVVIPVAVSARHVHLSQQAVEALFGKGYQLTRMKNLRQPGAWAAQETVKLIGPKGTFEHVRVLGPVRSRTQIEVSRTDSFTLGVEAPVRQSGDLEGTPTLTLQGPAGDFTTDGLIIAARHIHMSPAEAQAMGLKHGDYVHVTVGENGRQVSFANVSVRVSEDFITEMHIDTDEANAAGISHQTQGELVVHTADCRVHITGAPSMQLAA